MRIVASLLMAGEACAPAKVGETTDMFHERARSILTMQSMRALRTQFFLAIRNFPQKYVPAYTRKRLLIHREDEHRH
jgi:hypothetical protein